MLELQIRLRQIKPKCYTSVPNCKGGGVIFRFFLQFLYTNSNFKTPILSNWDCCSTPPPPYWRRDRSWGVP